VARVSGAAKKQNRARVATAGWSVENECQRVGLHANVPVSMFDFPFSELISPDEQLAVARCVAIMASRDCEVTIAERRFLEDLMGRMMLLPEERDRVRREFQNPSNLAEAAAQVRNREARIFLFYQAICAAFADNDLVEREFDALLSLAETFEFDRSIARDFIVWARDSLILRERGQQLVMEL
jgi:uncharacterized membrane protein YebE (DUF533 family)